MSTPAPPWATTAWFNSEPLTLAGLRGRVVGLEAFLHEYRITFPVGVDAHEGDDPTPVTFARYGLRGTPSTVLIDRDGTLQGHHFGVVPNMFHAVANSPAARRLQTGLLDPR